MEIFLVKMQGKSANEELFSRESCRNTFNEIFAAVVPDVKAVIVCGHTDGQRKGQGRLLTKT